MSAPTPMFVGMRELQRDLAAMARREPTEVFLRRHHRELQRAEVEQATERAIRRAECSLRVYDNTRAGKRDALARLLEWDPYSIT
jgi:hypothetical protein